MKHLSQIELMGAVCKWLDRQGFKDVTTRQMNVIAQATNMIVDAMNAPYVPATPGMGLAAWRASDETGLSSLAIVDHLWPGNTKPRTDHPRDPGDFGRCVGLLDAVPEFRPRIHEMKGVSPEWAVLVAHWDELESLWRNHRHKDGKCQKLHNRMYVLLVRDLK